MRFRKRSAEAGGHTVDFGPHRRCKYNAACSRPSLSLTAYLSWQIFLHPSLDSSDIFSRHSNGKQLRRLVVDIIKHRGLFPSRMVLHARIEENRGQFIIREDISNVSCGSINGEVVTLKRLHLSMLTRRSEKLTLLLVCVL